MNKAKKIGQAVRKNMANAAGRDYRTFEAGEKTAAMTEQFNKGLAGCIQQNRHRQEPYFILFHSSWYMGGEELRMTFSPRDKRPPKMLKTMCFVVDNKKGTCEPLWILPPDAPSIIAVPETKVCVPIAESAKDIPIIYG